MSKINLPRYKCPCGHSGALIYNRHCLLCDDKGYLSYQDALNVYRTNNLPSHLLIPQCHICTKFDEGNNFLFAYCVYKKDDEYRLIYRCKNGHGHDNGKSFLDIHTGLEVII